MSTALIQRRKRFGVPLPARVILVLQNHHVTLPDLVRLTIKDLIRLGLTEFEARGALLVAGQKATTP